MKLPSQVLMAGAMTGLGDSTVGYAVLIVLLVAVAVVVLVRLIAVFKILKQRHTRGERAGVEYEEIYLIR